MRRMFEKSVTRDVVEVEDRSIPFGDVLFSNKDLDWGNQRGIWFLWNGSQFPGEAASRSVCERGLGERDGFLFSRSGASGDGDSTRAYRRRCSAKRPSSACIIITVERYCGRSLERSLVASEPGCHRLRW